VKDKELNLGVMGSKRKELWEPIRGNTLGYEKTATLKNLEPLPNAREKKTTRMIEEYMKWGG